MCITFVYQSLRRYTVLAFDRSKFSCNLSSIPIFTYRVHVSIRCCYTFPFTYTYSYAVNPDNSISSYTINYLWQVSSKCHILVRTVVIFLFVIFNSSYIPFFPHHLVNKVCLSTILSFSFRRECHILPMSVRSSVSLTCIQHWCMPNFYSLINARFKERRTDANLHACVAIIGDILSSHDKNQIHVHNHARVHTLS